MKKVIALTSAAAFLLSAVPALAGGWMPQMMQSSDVEIEVENEGTFVSNNVVTVAKTGNNMTSGGFVATGDATAVSYAENDVNGTYVGVKAPCWGCKGDVEVEVENEKTFVGNDVTTVAKTGGNMVMSMPSRCRHTSGGVVLTGSAVASSEAVNVVNSSIVRVRR